MALCVVTGAAGFIGSHLCEALLEEGHSVRGIDALTDAYPRAQKEANIDLIKRHPRAKHFDLLLQDLLHANLLNVVKGADFAFHLAAQPGVRLSWGERFAEYLERNVLATHKLLESCRQHKLKKFVYASSSSVYGEGKSGALSESERCEPFSPYGVTKLAGENLCLSYQKNFDVPAVAVRYFTVFGPRQRPDMAFYHFLKGALVGETVKIFGDGEQTRDFTSVTDAVAGTLAAAMKGEPGGIYNLGGGCRASIIAVIRLIEENMKAPLRVVFEEAAKGDVRHTWSDSTRARQVLGFAPKVTLAEGLLQELEWLKGLKI